MSASPDVDFTIRVFGAEVFHLSTTTAEPNESRGDSTSYPVGFVALQEGTCAPLAHRTAPRTDEQPQEDQ